MRTMTSSVQQTKKAVGGSKKAQPLLEQWRRDLVEVDVELKQPRVIDPVSTNSASGEPIEPEGTSANRFRGQVVYFTDVDVTVRRPSGAMLVIDNYAIAAISDGKNRFELARLPKERCDPPSRSRSTARKRSFGCSRLRRGPSNL
jgi:hypothetical protein